MILFIDNYDSFTYNLVDIFGQMEPELQVYRNDRISLDDIEQLQPEGIVISPGPGTPEQAGICCALIERFHSRIPILGVCLGHQCIGKVFGADVRRGPAPFHGKTSDIFHDRSPLFAGVPSPFRAGRYHSLIVEKESLPASLKITAQTADSIIMGLQHRRFPVTGVQFHPESILTESGAQLIANWLRLIKAPGQFIAGKNAKTTASSTFDR